MRFTVVRLTSTFTDESCTLIRITDTWRGYCDERYCDERYCGERVTIITGCCDEMMRVTDHI